MKKKKLNAFEEYVSNLSEENKNQINDFFSSFNNVCRLSKSDKNKMRKDFENAILYYFKNGITLKETLKLLALENLGGFYARDALSWFPLDDAAKIYPVSMEHGVMSVFRLAVNLKEDVVPELLQMALTFTIKRFPSFATTLKKGVFWHYLDSTKRCFNVYEENDIPCQCLKVSQSGSQSFRVLYYHTRISVEFFHVLTDASGGLEFLKSLVSEYIRLKGIVINDNGNILNVNDIPDAEEYKNEFESNLQRLVRYRYLSGEKSDMLCDGYLRVIIAQLCFEEQRQGDDKQSTRAKHILHDVLNDIHTTPAADFDWDKYAAECFLSRDRFNHVFREHVGDAPERYRIKVCMERAKMLLCDFGMSVGECAETLGFRDVSYFCRRFKAHHGISPGEVRKNK